jgi:hypothetical protein
MLQSIEIGVCICVQLLTTNDRYYIVHIKLFMSKYSCTKNIFPNYVRVLEPFQVRTGTVHCFCLLSGKVRNKNRNLVSSVSYHFFMT